MQPDRDRPHHRDQADHEPNPDRVVRQHRRPVGGAEQVDEPAHDEVERGLHRAGHHRDDEQERQRRADRTQVEPSETQTVRGGIRVSSKGANGSTRRSSQFEEHAAGGCETAGAPDVSAGRHVPTARVVAAAITATGRGPRPDLPSRPLFMQGRRARPSDPGPAPRPTWSAPLQRRRHLGAAAPPPCRPADRGRPRRRGNPRPRPGRGPCWRSPRPRPCRGRGPGRSDSVTLQFAPVASRASQLPTTEARPLVTTGGGGGGGATGSAMTVGVDGDECRLGAGRRRRVRARGRAGRRRQRRGGHGARTGSPCTASRGALLGRRAGARRVQATRRAGAERGAQAEDGECRQSRAQHRSTSSQAWEQRGRASRLTRGQMR